MIDKTRLILLSLRGGLCTYEDFLWVLTDSFRKEFIKAQAKSERTIGEHRLVQKPLPVHEMHYYFHNIAWKHSGKTWDYWNEKYNDFEFEVKKLIC